MKSLLAIGFAVAMATGFSSGTALAAYQGRTSSSTSMGWALGSPSERAPRSAVVPSTPAHREAVALDKTPGKVTRCNSFQPKADCDHPK